MTAVIDTSGCSLIIRIIIIKGMLWLYGTTNYLNCAVTSETIALYTTQGGRQLDLIPADYGDCQVTACQVRSVSWNKHWKTHRQSNLCFQTEGGNYLEKTYMHRKNMQSLHGGSSKPGESINQDVVLWPVTINYSFKMTIWNSSEKIVCEIDLINSSNRLGMRNTICRRNHIW